VQTATGVAIAGAVALVPAQAQETVKIGSSADDRRSGVDRQADRQCGQTVHAAKGDTVAGKKIEVILKDDAAVPDNTKRLAQELIVNDKVNFIAGFWCYSSRAGGAPLATQAKIPEIVMARGPRSLPSVRPISCAPASRWRSRPPSSATGPQERHQESRDPDVGLRPR